MTDDDGEQVPEQERRANAWRLRRDLVLGAAVVFVLYLVFRHHDSNGNATHTPSPTSSLITTGAP